MGLFSAIEAALCNIFWRSIKLQKVEGFYGEMYLLNETNNQIAIIGKFGIGAPVVVTLLEELIAHTAKNVFVQSTTVIFLALVAFYRKWDLALFIFFCGAFYRSGF